MRVKRKGIAIVKSLFYRLCAYKIFREDEVGKGGIVVEREGEGGCG